jgi:hypothetical protein
LVWFYAADREIWGKKNSRSRRFAVDRCIVASLGEAGAPLDFGPGFDEQQARVVISSVLLPDFDRLSV